MADVRTNLRIPDELYEQIKQLAAKEYRSINAQMIALLQEALEKRQGEQQQPEDQHD